MGAGSIEAELSVALIVGCAGRAGSASAGNGDADGFETVVGHVGNYGAVGSGGTIGVGGAGRRGFCDADFGGI